MLSLHDRLKCGALAFLVLGGAPTAKTGLLADSSLRIEPYGTPYAILPHR